MIKQHLKHLGAHLEWLDTLNRCLAEQTSQAVLRADHARLQKLLEAVKMIPEEEKSTSQLYSILEILEGASASQTESANSRPSVELQLGEYPRFRLEGKQLIKTGRSRNGSEYEHAVSQDTYYEILARLNRLAAERDAFTSEQVESMTEELGCPVYQMYVVLGFLRKKKLLSSERKGRYRFSPDFSSEAEQVWAEPLKRRPVADDVVAVLERIRRFWGQGSDASELRKEAIRDYARGEVGIGRFVNEVAAENSIHDACVRRLGYTEVSEFDHHVDDWLRGRSDALYNAVRVKVKTECQHRRLAEVLGRELPT